MIPPKGFKSELYPLRHRVIYSFGLSAKSVAQDTALCTLVRNTSDVIANTPKTIVVNPHNTNYVEDNGPAVQKMSIIDKLTLSIKFNMTANCTAIDKIPHISFLWRPIFFSFREKLDAADDDTGTTVSSILGLTVDDTFEDVVPVTTGKLPVAGDSELSQPVSTVNIAEVFGDYNMTTDTTMENHTFVEDTFHSALRRFTNKGALKACVGRTRYVHLTDTRPNKNFFIKKFVPRSIRRVMPFTFMAIQVHMPVTTEIDADYHAINLAANVAHVGCKIICLYHEWNSDHFQDMSGAAPVPP